MEISNDRTVVLPFEENNTRKFVAAVNNKTIEQILHFNRVSYNIGCDENIDANTKLHILLLQGKYYKIKRLEGVKSLEVDRIKNSTFNIIQQVREFQEDIQEMKRAIFNLVRI
jgi:hypothetical protein